MLYLGKYVLWSFYKPQIRGVISAKSVLLDAAVNVGPVWLLCSFI